MTDIALTKSELIAEAIAHGGSLGEKDHQFLQSLISQYVEKEKLSEKQWYWVGKLVERATLTEEAAGVPEFEDSLGLFASINALFDSAASCLQHPAIVLYTTEGALRIRKGEKRVFIKKGATFDAPLLGHIDKFGEFKKGADTPSPVMYRALLELAENPVRAVQNSAKLSGRCSFCNSGLEDPKSLSVGYGPTCAKSYSLPWG